MSKVLNLTKEMLQELRWLGKGEKLEGHDLWMVERGDWEDEGKIDCCTNIIRDAEGTHYMYTESRSGSYYTDYYYEEGPLDAYEAEPYEVTKTDWRLVKGKAKPGKAVPKK